jgi:hypothetical protein
MFLSILEDEIRHHEAFNCLLQELDIKVHDFTSPMKRIKTVFFLSDSGSWFMWEEYSIADGGIPWP